METKHTEPINEIVNLCNKKDGFGFIAKLHTIDRAPAHIHILNADEQEITRILLSDNIPQSIDDIKIYNNDPDISDELKEQIVKWAKSTKRTEINNWKYVLDIWNDNCIEQ